MFRDEKTDNPIIAKKRKVKTSKSKKRTTRNNPRMFSADGSRNTRSSKGK